MNTKIEINTYQISHYYLNSEKMDMYIICYGN